MGEILHVGCPVALMDKLIGPCAVIALMEYLVMAGHVRFKVSRTVAGLEIFQFSSRLIHVGKKQKCIPVI